MSAGEAQPALLGSDERERGPCERVTGGAALGLGVLDRALALRPRMLELTGEI
jgi:hypothetical protein